MIIAVGSDHKGFALKKEIIDLVTLMGFEIMDFGTGSEVPVDYPKFAYLVSKAVATGKAYRGILVSATGIDMSIVANKIKGVIAARCVNWKEAQISREQNSSNVLCLGEDADINLIIEVWLTVRFDAHQFNHQIEQISQIEGTHAS